MTFSTTFPIFQNSAVFFRTSSSHLVCNWASHRFDTFAFIGPRKTPAPLTSFTMYGWPITLHITEVHVPAAGNQSPPWLAALWTSNLLILWSSNHTYEPMTAPWDENAGDYSMKMVHSLGSSAAYPVKQQKGKAFCSFAYFSIQNLDTCLSETEGLFN